MRNKITCCKDCPDRWVNEHGRCHSTCKKYKAQAKELKAQKNAEYKDKSCEYTHTAYVIDKRRK